MRQKQPSTQPERDSKGALQLLGLLLALWLILRVADAATYTDVSLGLVIVAFVIFGAILVAFYNAARDGSKTARYVLTAYFSYLVVISLAIIALGRSAWPFSRIAETLVSAGVRMSS